MGLDCTSYHMVFFLFLLQATTDYQEKMFGLVRVKLDSFELNFAEVLPIFDTLYHILFGLATWLFWRASWTMSFRKVLFALIIVRSALCFVPVAIDSDGHIVYSGFLWALQGLLQGVIQAPLTGLILQRFRSTGGDDISGRWSEYRYSLFLFFVGLMSSCLSFLSSPSITDETLASTMVTVGLLLINVLNYVVCFYPLEQVEHGLAALRNEKEAPSATGFFRRTCSALGDRLRELKTFVFNRQLFPIFFGLTACNIVKYYMFWKVPLEMYWRALYPAPPFQIMFLGSAAAFELIGLIGCVLLYALRNRISCCRNMAMDRPFALAFLLLVPAAFMYLPFLQDLDQIEESIVNMNYLALYVFASALMQYARATLLGPQLLSLAESYGNAPAVLAAAQGFTYIATGLCILLAYLLPIDNAIQQCLPFSIVVGMVAFVSFVVDWRCGKRPTIIVSNISSSYRPLISDNSAVEANP